MPEVIDLHEFLNALTVIIVISFFITIAWLSTYVRDQPVVATAVVVFQQDSSSSSTTRIGLQTMNRTAAETPSENIIQISEEEQLISSTGSTGAEDIESEELSECTPISDSEESEKEIKSEASDYSNSSNQNHYESNNMESGEISNQNCKQSVSIPEDGSCSSVSPGNGQKERKTTKEVIISSSKAGSSNSEAPSQIIAEAEVEEEISQESIRIKLRFVDDTQRLVRGSLTDEVGNFKRANFDPELSSNRVVRLIFNGQLLNRDHSTLGQYGLFDNCVVHCHISQPQPLSSNERNVNHESEGLDLSEILSPLLLVIVAALWYLRYEYSHNFNTSATIILVFLTALLLVSQFAFTVNLELSLGYGNSGNDRRNTPGPPRTASSGSESQIERNNIPPHLPTRNTGEVEDIVDRRSDHEPSGTQPIVRAREGLACFPTPTHTSLNNDESFTTSNHRPRLNAIHSNS